MATKHLELIGHVRYIIILIWIRGFRVKIANFTFVFQFPKGTCIQRKQHQIWKFVLKASEPCCNIDISNTTYYDLVNAIPKDWKANLTNPVPNVIDDTTVSSLRTSLTISLVNFCEFFIVFLGI